MYKTKNAYEQIPSDIPIVSPEAYAEHHDMDISPDYNSARRVGNVGIIDFTETHVQDPVWLKVLDEIPADDVARKLGRFGSYEGSVERASEWTAFQGNLNSEERKALPEMRYVSWSRSTLAGENVDDLKHLVIDKLIPQSEGSIWLPNPKGHFEAAVPSNGEIPASLSFVQKSNLLQYTDTTYDYSELGAEEGDLVPDGFVPKTVETYILANSLNVDFSGIEDESGKMQNAQTVRVSLNPAGFIKDVLAYSMDAQDLWYGNGNKGLYDIALKMAQAATRIAEETATQQDREDMLIQAGIALDLLDAQDRRLHHEREQQKFIDGDISAVQELGHQALQSGRK